MTTEDLKSAYRQVPLAPSDVRYAITGVYNHHTGEVDLHELYGQPFGAGHAVPNFCRVAEWINRCAQKLFSAYMDHFFDDFFVIDRTPPNHSVGTLLSPAAIPDFGVFIRL